MCDVVPGGLKLGKKISVPQDVMMEELNLPSNRGSRMFQERQRRVEKYILESVANGTHSAIDVRNQRVASAKPLVLTAVTAGDKPTAVCA